MKVKLWAACGLLAGTVLLGAGCQTVSDLWDGIFGDGSSGNGEIILPPDEGPGKWGEGVPKSKDQWVPIPGVNFPPVYFAYDQFRIGASEQAKLERVSAYLAQNKGVGLIIEGHCDDRGSVEYNRALGERRAMAIRDYLANLGVDAARMHTVSYGEERPAEAGASETAWAKNRRGETIPAKMN